MKTIRRILGDLKRGENLDLYITLSVAMVVSLLNLLGGISSDKVTAVVLSVLGLITITTVVNRYRIEDLASKMSPSVDNIFVDNFTDEFETDLHTCDEIWIFGVTLSGLVQNNYSLFERKLKQNHKFRIMLVNPECQPALEMSEARIYGRPDIQRTANDIRNTLRDLHDLKQMTGGAIEIRTLDHPMGHRTVAVNPSSPKGKIYVTNYPFKVPGGASPKFMLRAKDKKWFDFYRSEAELQWEAAKVWELAIETMPNSSN